MFNTTSSASAAFNTLSAKTLGLALLACVCTASVAPVAMAGDAEITLKLAASVPADTLLGRVNIGGAALEKIEPEEIDFTLNATSGATATGAAASLKLGSTVNLQGLELCGLSADALSFDREGLVHLSVGANLVTLPGQRVKGVQTDATGRWVNAEYDASLVLEAQAATLHDERGLVIMDTTFVLVDIAYQAARDFAPSRLVLNPKATVDKASILETDLPDQIQANPATTQGNAGCNTATGMCACGDAGGCNTLIAVCFDGQVNGNWDCLGYNDEGQCILGICDVGL